MFIFMLQHPHLILKQDALTKFSSELQQFFLWNDIGIAEDDSPAPPWAFILFLKVFCLKAAVISIPCNTPSSMDLKLWPALYAQDGSLSSDCYEAWFINLMPIMLLEMEQHACSAINANNFIGNNGPE
jgi:hypothetical protein